MYVGNDVLERIVGVETKNGSSDTYDIIYSCHVTCVDEFTMKTSFYYLIQKKLKSWSLDLICYITDIVLNQVYPKSVISANLAYS